MRLVSVPRLKQFLEITNSDNDLLLSLLVDFYSVRIESYLRRKLEAVERVKIDNGGKRLYALPAYPVSEVTKPVVEVYGSTYTEDADYFVWYDRGMIEFFVAPTTTWPKAVKITWTGGYAVIDDSSIDTGTLDVPYDIKLACILQTAFMFRRRRDLGMSTITLPDGSLSTQFAGALLPEVIEILKTYRSMVGYG